MEYSRASIRGGRPAVTVSNHHKCDLLAAYLCREKAATVLCFMYALAHAYGALGRGVKGRHRGIRFEGHILIGGVYRAQRTSVAGHATVSAVQARD